MNIIADLHTHTLVSHHAYSTVAELVSEAKKKNLYALAITDHGPGLDDGAHILHFKCLNKLPASIDGVRLLHGVELNIMNYAGEVDLDNTLLSKLDFVIASYHREVIKKSSIDDHTNGWLSILSNPFIDCMGHSGNPAYTYDFEKVIKECKRFDKVVEINTSSEEARPGSLINCKEIISLCKKHSVYVSINSDSHSKWTVGDFWKGLKLLKEAGFPEKLVINASIENLEEFFQRKKKRLSCHNSKK